MATRHTNRYSVSGVYAISHELGKVYVGSSVCIAYRWSLHRQDLEKGKHHSIRLQRSWNKYGPNSFSWEVLEIVPPERAKLVEREQFHIDRLKSSDPKYGFNISPTAGSPLGHKHTAETRARMSAALIGNQYAKGNKFTEESRAKVSEALRNRPRQKGWKHTQEARDKISAYGMNREPSPETKAKISASHKGKKRTQEHCANISASLTGKKASQETRAKMSESRKGRTNSPETRAKLSAALKGRKFTPEWLEKIKESRKSYKITDEHRANLSAGISAAHRRRKNKPSDGQGTLSFID